MHMLPAGGEAERRDRLLQIQEETCVSLPGGGTESAGERWEIR